MSKLLFWSPCHGLGQTSNIHALTIIFNMVYKKKTLLMQTHFKNNNLECPLVGYPVENQKMKDDIFQGIGLDMAVTYSNMKCLNSSNLRNCCLTPTPTIWLLPGTEMKNRESYERDIGRSVGYVIRDVDPLMDMVVIDANSGNDIHSMEMMEIADVIIINLTQRRFILEKFFQEYGELFWGKSNVFYLFGDYDVNSSYHINNIRRKYSKYITGKNSGVIPYCTKYLDAQNESNVIQFLQKGVNENKSLNKRSKLSLGGYSGNGLTETDYFFNQSLSSAEKLMKIVASSCNSQSREEKAI